MDLSILVGIFAGFVAWVIVLILMGGIRDELRQLLRGWTSDSGGETETEGERLCKVEQVF
jgi:ABC-type lipoprotein release transport system permease subunit